jgi:predicted acetyltransferase
MTVEIRPLSQEEMPRFHHNLSTGFSQTPRPESEDRPQELRPEWTLCAFEDGELATTYAAFPFTLHLNGRTAPAAGVTGVSTLPWHRRRGHLRRIMETDFARMHDDGGPALAILYASMAAIYQRFGYAIVSTHLRYHVEPHRIEFADPVPVRGRMGSFTRETVEKVAPVYEAFAAERTGYLVRGELEWQHLTIGYGEGPAALVTYEEEGEVLGYLVYWHENKEREAFYMGGTVQVYVGDFVWLTPAAYQALWDYLRRVDLARRINCFRMPSDDPAKDLFLEPRLLYALEQDGLLARIVTVEKALTQRGYEIDGRVSFELRDDMAPWNTGRWELEAGPEGARVRRTDRAPQMTMPVAALAPVLFGHFTASQGVRMGRIEANDPAALPRWDELFRTKFPPACANGF